MRNKWGKDGHVFQRVADGKWVAQAIVVHRRISFVGETREEAVSKLKEALVEIRKTQFVNTGDATFNEWFKHWLLNIEDCMQTERTTKLKYEIYQLFIGPMFAGEKIAGMTYEKADKIMNETFARLGVSPQTRKAIRGPVREAIRIAYVRGMAGEVAYADKPPRFSQIRREEPYTKEEVRQVIDAIRKHKLSSAFAFLIGTGAKRGELLALRWEDVDLDKKSVTFKKYVVGSGAKTELKEYPKGKKNKTIPLSNKMVHNLKAHYVLQLKERASRERRGKEYFDNGLVFCQQNGKMMYPRNFTSTFNRWLRDGKVTRRKGSMTQHTYRKITKGASKPKDIRKAVDSWL